MANKQFRALALLLAVFAFSSILLVACARPGTPGASSSNNASSAPTSSSASCASGDTVKTGPATFEQTCINLAKGATLKIVPDTGSAYHILDYGAWNNGTAQPAAAPAGAPALKGLTVQSAAVTIGPFTTAGTYQIYCTVHTNMNLTVTVK